VFRKLPEDVSSGANKMKEFEDWMKKSDLSNYWNCDEEDAAKVGWKAALKWALENSLGCNAECECCCGSLLHIEKELKDESI